MDVSYNVCPACSGDPRASQSCSHCHGAQVTLTTPEGVVVWNTPFEEFTFVFRRARLFLNAIFHIFLGALATASVAAFIVVVTRLEQPVEVLTKRFWFEGSWYVTVLWIGCLLGAFLIYRLAVFGQEAKPLPGWGQSIHVPHASITSEIDMTKHIHPAVWEVLERGYGLAKKLGLTEVSPAHVFAAALTSPAGGIFITRLGLDFDKIKDGLREVMQRGQTGDPTLASVELKRVLLAAYADAQRFHRKMVGVIELFLQAFSADEAIQSIFDAAGYPSKDVQHAAQWIGLQESMKEEHDRFVALSRLKPSSSMNRTMTARQTPLLNHLSEDLTLLARQGYLAPLVGRASEMEELLRGIESGRRSVVLVGEDGVGKTTLVEGLARRMVEEDVPPELFDRRLVSVHLPQLLGAGDPAQAAERLLALLREASLSGNIILVLEGIESLVGVGLGASMDLAETLVAELDRSGLVAIGTTSPEAWTQYLERRSIGSRFIRVNIPPLDEEEALFVLMAKSGYIEYQNRVFFSSAALQKAIAFAGRYLQTPALPESALQIAREAAVLVRKERAEGAIISVEDVARIVHQKTHIPVEAVSQDESDKLLHLEEYLHRRVIGQEEAVTAVSQALRRARAEIREGKRPIANFLFLGPTGVGKTELAKALAAEYFGSEQTMIRIDMSEYQDGSSVSRMIGTSGDPRGGLLTEAIRKNPFSLVLLDELEKAHPDILTLFLQVMDDGRITDGVGRTIDCTNVVLIATSNAGTTFIQDQFQAQIPTEQIKTALLERELKGIFRPEFLNRFDGIIVFKPLTLDDVTQIAWLLMGSITKRLEEKGIGFRAEDAAVEELAKAGYDPVFGARPLRRTIQERVENALADLLLRKGVQRRETVVLQTGGTLRVEKT